jgi:hypothetical protein
MHSIDFYNISAVAVNAKILELAPGIILPDYFFGGGVKEWFY